MRSIPQPDEVGSWVSYRSADRVGAGIGIDKGGGHSPAPGGSRFRTCLPMRCWHGMCRCS